MHFALSTYLRYGESRVDRVKRSMVGLQPASHPVHAYVADGRQAGAEAAISQSSFSIGPRLEDDLYIFEKVEQDGQSIDIAVTTSMLGQFAQISTARDDVFVNDLPVASGATVERLPCCIEYPPAKVMLNLDPDLVENVQSWSTILWSLGLSMVAVVMAGLAVSQLQNTSPPQVIESSEPASVALPTDVGDLIDEARELYATAGLGRFVDVERVDRTTVLISGNISAAQDEAWNRTLLQVDGLFGSHNTVFEVSRLASLDDLPAISSVALGQHAFISLSDGRRLQLGDIVTGQWILHAISDTDFTVRRGDETIVITYW